MTKASRNEIIWYEPANERRKPYATMNADGILCFGLDMRDKLPRTIRIGFLPDECVLCVEANADKGFIRAVNGSVKLFGIAMQLQRLGFELPVHFMFIEEKQDSLWKGYIVPPPRKPRPQAARKTTPLTEHPYLISAYKWLIDKAVRSYAKTTPMDERRATANAALWEALSTYTPIHGALKDYLFGEIKKHLIEKNKQYTYHSPHRIISLDAPVNNNSETDMTGYDLFFPRYTNEMTSVENKIDMEIFQYTYLDPQERKILKMLLDGYTVEEIQDDCQITWQELDRVCLKIGSRWEWFIQADSAA